MRRLAWLAFLFVSCRDEQAGPRPHPGTSSPAFQAPAAVGGGGVVDQLPSDLTFRSGATWSQGAILYIGARVSPPQSKPGETVTVTHYFAARQQPPDGFKLFVHIVDSANGQMLQNADHELQVPLAQWPVGRIVTDAQQVVVPQSQGAPRLLLGFWREDQRLPVDQPQAHDGNNRMIGPPIMTAQEQAPLPEYTVRRTSKPPVIDGSLNDPAWQQAAAVELHGSFDGRPVQRKTTARLLYDDQFLYVAFDCEDPDVWGTLYKRDDPIYNQEAVEIFLDANGDGKTYNEIEVSPNNTLFDAYFETRRSDLAKAITWDSSVTSAVKVRGTLNNDSDRDDGWSVEMQIPIAKLAEVPNVPPKPGDRWRFNLYRLEHIVREKQVEGQSFSPLYQGDFHNLPRFGWLVFQ